MYASVSSTVKLHDLSSGNIVDEYEPSHNTKGLVRNVAWSRDGSWLAIVPFAGHTEIVGTRGNLKLLRKIQEVEHPSCVSFLNATKKNIGLGCKSGIVMIYDVKMKSVKKKFPRASSEITHIDFTLKDTHCVAACENGEVLVYGNITNSPPCSLRVPKSCSVTCLKTNRVKRNLIIGGSNEGTVVVWDCNDTKIKFQAEAHKGAAVTSVAFSPVNCDLIISAGCDRKFCFFDITDRRCIASVPVEHNITALDFSPDGTYFVMGSFNGKIHVYDSRNIQEAVHSFQAHDNTINYLLFQNLRDIRDTSLCSITSDVVKTPAEPIKRCSEMFDFLITANESIKTPDNPRKSSARPDDYDSFLHALGLDKNTTGDLSRMSEGSFSVEISPIVESIPTPKTGKVNSKTEVYATTSKPLFSTPNLLADNAPDIIPASSVSINGPLLATADVKNIIKETIREELKSVMDELKADMKYQTAHVTMQTRKLFSDLLMKIVRESIKAEDNYNTLREDIRRLETSLDEMKNRTVSNNNFLY